MERHITVLAEEAIAALNIKKHASIVDATLGAGGHGREILSRLDRGGVFVGIDADPSAIETARVNPDFSGSRAGIHLVTGNFRNIDAILENLGLKKVDGILADLGWRMEQVEKGGKGFSFRKDEPLVMTYGDPNEYLFTAEDIVNDWEESDIANVLKGYGEERFARRIAQRIVEARKIAPITRSIQLAHIVESGTPHSYTKGKIHPATRTFQALRIAVNDELAALTEFIEKAVLLLLPEGRLAIISFHSTEDRIVKHAFRTLAQRQEVKLVNKRPITPEDREITNNPRARSAKLRVLEKVSLKNEQI